MKSSERRTEFEARLLNTLRAIADDLIAWVVLPNHYHFLAYVQSLNHISAGLKHLHGSTSREWNLEDNLTGKRRVWYKFADTYIKNDAYLHIAFNYIHHNPVKHGYVSDPYNWPCSSLFIYDEDKGRNWLQEPWKTYTPPVDFGKGWDDDVMND